MESLKEVIKLSNNLRIVASALLMITNFIDRIQLSHKPNNCMLTSKTMIHNIFSSMII